jgi:hypothetical protein
MLLALGIVFPGMLAAWWLLFPNKVELAGKRIESTPWKSFGLGILGAVGIAIPVFVLFALPLPFAKFMGAVLLFGGLGFAGLGAAGMVKSMAGRLQERSSEKMTTAAAFVRAAVALELAAAFPMLGWFIVIPLTTIVSLGAAIFALLGWAPKEAAQPLTVKQRLVAEI